MNRLRQLLILITLIFLVILPFVVIQKAITETTTFYGVRFPSGESSFADAVISYQPGIYLNKENLPNVTEPFNNPRTALGIPNSSYSKKPFVSSDQRNDVALGLRGNIILSFKDNLLTVGGDTSPDLWIFQAGEKPKSVFVDISKDGINWYRVGEISPETNGIDIDHFKLWGKDDFFPYVRLIDNSLEGDSDGFWYQDKWIGNGGANIDAVGAISSVSLANIKDQ